MKHKPQIVITSTWRLDKPLATLIELLALLGTYVIGTTPELNEPFIKYIRQLEVEKYLSDHKKQHITWIAIDDTKAFYRPDANLLLTDGTKGFTDSNITDLSNLIQKVRF